ncbi:protein RCC2 homolog isoform X2 [Chelonus insularis]|uniref:protein RCC2 homolog isoform X2 n=1 Tax=Chelonus insularis TaxID=460826 RepID=UPI00158F26E2|nr:protein RCC2 homolog isoform X2 [Chelonus insularis]
MFYYSGLNVSPSIISTASLEYPVIDKYSQIEFDDIIDLTISWNYFLVWQKNAVFISGNINGNYKTELLTIPGFPSKKLCSAIAGKTMITFITNEREIWQYNVYENIWKKIKDFMVQNVNNELEYVMKIEGYHSVIALTNLGRVFNIPNLVEMPKRVKFIDIACGFEHTILLADNGTLYSMGSGRGQLGHGDLEDCDEPRLIEALAGLNIMKVSAGGWHSGVITSEGDVYTWGWNTNGELGIISEGKIIAIPTVVDFTDKKGKPLDIKMESIQCGNAFTMCLSENGILFGCGSNKYGQLGRSSQQFSHLEKFIELNENFKGKKIQLIKCQEWGSLIKVE